MASHQVQEAVVRRFKSSFCSSALSMCEAPPAPASVGYRDVQVLPACELLDLRTQVNFLPRRRGMASSRAPYVTNNSSSFVQLQALGKGWRSGTLPTPTGDEVGNFDIIKGKQYAYRIKQVYPKYTTKTFHWVGLAMPISHTVQTAWPVRRPAATLIGESKD